MWLLCKDIWRGGCKGGIVVKREVMFVKTVFVVKKEEVFVTVALVVKAWM